MYLVGPGAGGEWRVFGLQSERILLYCRNLTESPDCCRLLQTAELHTTAAMAEHLTKEQIEELQAAFEIFDKDSDGVITIDEMEEVVRSLGQLTRTEEVKDMIDQLDADNNGTVNLHEFLTMMGRKMTAGEEENELRQAFDVFDENSDGFIR